MRLSNLRSVLKRSERAVRGRRRSTGIAVSAEQPLEMRVLPAGNLTAGFLGNDALLTGDSSDNEFRVLLEGGNVVVRGTSGTTINGAEEDFILATGSDRIADDLVLRLVGGSNRVTIDEGVIIGDKLRVLGGSGSDDVGLVSVTVGRDIEFYSGGGLDRLNLDRSTVGRDVEFFASSAGSLVALTETTVGDDLEFFGSRGADELVVDSNSVVGDDARLYGRGGDDNIVIRNSIVSDDLHLRAGSGNDVVLLEDAGVGDKTRISGNSGDDNIAIRGTTQFFDWTRISGGSGNDAVESADTVIFDGIRVRRTESAAVDAAVVDARVSAADTGVLARAQLLQELFDPQLSLSVSVASVVEDAANPAAELTVTRTGDTSADLEVMLESSLPDRLAPSSGTVIIPAGQSSVTVDLTVIDNSVENDDVTVTLTASAAEFDNAEAAIDVENDDVPELTVIVAEDTVAEDSGSGTSSGSANTFSITVTREGDTAASLNVNLAYSPVGRITGPATATIPAGQSSVVVTGSTVPNTQVDGNAVGTVAATATGFGAGADTVEITDNDTAFLTVTFAGTGSSAAVDEGGTVEGTVRRNTPVTAPLTVTLTSSDETQLTVPATVTIPAGSATATFTATAADNQQDDGDRTVSVTASTTDFIDGAESVTVVDDDEPSLTVTLSASEAAEDAGAAAVQGTVTRSIVDITQPLTVTIGVTGDDRASAPAEVTIPADQTSVSFSIDLTDNNNVDGDGAATITASAAGLLSGDSVLSVTDDDTATVTITPAAATVTEGDSNTLTVNRSTDSSQALTVDLTYSDAARLSGPATVTFGAGISSLVIQLDVVDDSIVNGNADVVISASAAGHSTVMTTITVLDDEPLTLTTDVSSNAGIVQGNGGLITNQAAFTITGMTTPGANVRVDVDGDGSFTEGNVTAEADGSYSVTTTLLHDSTGLGTNPVRVRAFLNGVETIEDAADVHLAVGTVVRFQTNQDFDSSGAPDFFDVEMLDSDAPGTVSNFLSYTTDTATGEERFDDLLLQRLDNDFILQAGRFNIDGNSAVTELDRDADNDGNNDTIANEFDAANSNLRGTLSMALPANTPNGGSSEWFINITDNAFLDSALHTVFGRVINNGLAVIDAIAADLTPRDLSDLYGEFSLGETPTLNPPPNGTSLAGTVSVPFGSATATGVGTSFTTDVAAGDSLEIDGSLFFVDSVQSDTELTLTTVSPVTITSGTAVARVTPPNSDFVIFSDISAILDRI